MLIEYFVELYRHRRLLIASLRVKVREALDDDTFGLLKAHLTVTQFYLLLIQHLLLANNLLGFLGGQLGDGFFPVPLLHQGIQLILLCLRSHRFHRLGLSRELA